MLSDSFGMRSQLGTDTCCSLAYLNNNAPYHARVQGRGALSYLVDKHVSPSVERRDEAPSFGDVKPFAFPSSSACNRISRISLKLNRSRYNATGIFRRLTRTRDTGGLQTIVV